MFASNTSQVSSDAVFVEDIFSTTLYTGNGSTQTITNGIDLSTKGGLVWAKMRSNGSTTGHVLSDTARGPSQKLDTSSTGASSNWTPYGISAFGSTGFTVADDGAGNYITNNSGVNYASWTFRKQPKFFDVVTYTGNGTNGRTVAHSLGSTPGCIIVKRTDASNGWAVYHRAMNASPQDYMMRLNATDGAFTTSPSRWNNTLPTSTEFTLSGNDEVNGSGATYVAYLFAHNAGGFGLTGTDNVISCGSYVGTSANFVDVNLGYEPQWFMVKKADATGPWYIIDNMRDMSYSGTSNLQANASNAEQATVPQVIPSATGISLGYSGGGSGYNTNGVTYIYIAIRRGPMKVPTSGTSVFSPNAVTGNALVTTNFPVDSAWLDDRSGGSTLITDRLRGSSQTYYNNLATTSTAAENTGTGAGLGFDNNTGFQMNSWAGSTQQTIAWNFRRAPSFFDEVCYTGNGVNGRAISHNLGVAPELAIVKSRNNPDQWWVFSSAFAQPADNYFILNGTLAVLTATGYGFTTTSTTFTPSPVDALTANGSGFTYVAYLFATCAGVSKVGSYTGTGTTKQIDCGFTGGARFVLIKRTDSTGDWYVWDSARGIVSGNDPYLLLNSTAAETTGTDYIDTYSAGFEISSTAPAAINASGGTFIFLAIA